MRIVGLGRYFFVLYAGFVTLVMPSAYADAPIIRLQGETNEGNAQVLQHFVRTGAVPLTLAGSYDPDGDPLDIQWSVIPANTSYSGTITINNADQISCSVSIPTAAVNHRIRIRASISDGSTTRTREIELRPINSIKICPLGDSLTESFDSYGVNALHRSYRRWLWEDLAAAGRTSYLDFVGSGFGILRAENSMPYDPDPGLNWDKNHEGWVGIRTDEMLFGSDGRGRLAEWLADYRPDIVLLHMGTNDAIQQFDMNSARDNISGIIDTLRGDNPNVMILLAQIIPCPFSPQSQANVEYLNSILPALATSKTTFRSPIYLVDQFNSGAGNHLVDRIHPNATGERLMADAWFEVLNPLLEPPATTVPVRITSGPWPSAETTEPYSFRIPIAGGVAPYTFQGISGSIPPGLTIDQTGVITGLATTDGLYPITLRVTDAQGTSDQRDFSIFVETLIPPGLPEADFETNELGLHASFDASTSLDPDGSLVRYQWNFGDNTGDQEREGRQLSYTFPAAGNYPVRLTVTDNEGRTNSITKTISIGDTAGADNIPNPLLNLALLPSATITGHPNLTGNPRDILYNPQTGEYATETQWASYGAGFMENLGVVTENDPFYWQVEWPSAKRINYLTMGGSFSNQPQANTAWRLQIRQNGNWRDLNSGLGGWIDGGTLEWGGVDQAPVTVDGVRIVLFSWQGDPLIGPSLRGRGASSLQLDDSASEPKATLIQYLVADVDEDGMPDSWEQTFGFIVGIDDSNEDADFDGFPNLSEWVAGTHPRNPAQFQAIQFMSRPDRSEFKLEAPLIPNRLFQIESATDLDGLDWEPITDPFPGFTDRPWPLALPNPTGETRFYRMRIQQP